MNRLAILPLVLLASCATLKTDVKAFVNGAVTCLEADKPAAEALGKSILVDALVAALGGASPGDVFDKAKADAEAGAIAQGIPVAACALDDVVADLTKFLHPERASIMARGGEDPMAEGQRVLAEFNAVHGVTSVRH